MLWIRNKRLVASDGRLIDCDECPCRTNYAVLITGEGSDGAAPDHPDGNYSVHDLTIEVPCLTLVPRKRVLRQAKR